jgi:hypothetical protein
MVVPVQVQHRIAQKALLVAATAQQAWRCVTGTKLTATTSLPPNRFADVGLGRIAAGGQRIHS